MSTTIFRLNFSTNATTELFAIADYDYVGTFLEARKITCKVVSIEPIDFLPYSPSGYDYILYQGYRFILIDTPAGSNRNKAEKYEYNLIFYGPEMLLKNVPLLDVVTGTASEIDKVRYSNGSDFSFFGDATQLADRIEASIVAFNSGLDRKYSVGNIGVTVTDVKERVESNVVIQSGTDCYSALRIFYDTFGFRYYVNYAYTSSTIYPFVGMVYVTNEDPPVINFTFEQGYGKGLFTISSGAANDAEAITRIYPSGGNRNLPRNYKENSLPADPSRYCPSLLLPDNPDGTLRFFLDSPNVATLGIRAKSESSAFQGIYPSIRDTTISDIYGGSFPPAGNVGNDGVNTEGLVATTRVDKIIGSSAIYGTASERFYIYTTDLGFNLNKVDGDVYVYATAVDAVISVRTGMYGGVEFVIVRGGTRQINSEDGSGWFEAGARYEIEVFRRELDNQLLPYYVDGSTPALAAGTEFVILNIFMPDVYVTMAENKLLKASQEYLALNDHTNFSVSLDFSTGFTLENPALFYYSVFREGNRCRVLDKALKLYDLQDNTQPLQLEIQNITIKFTSEDPFPKYDCTLNNIKPETIFEKLGKSIDAVSRGQVLDNSLTAEAMQRIGTQLYRFNSMFEFNDTYGAIKAKAPLYSDQWITAGGINSRTLAANTRATGEEEIPYEKTLEQKYADLEAKYNELEQILIELKSQK